jgi:hypothetical protein
MKWVEDKDMVLWNQRAAARNTQYDRSNSDMPMEPETAARKKKKQKPRKLKKIKTAMKKLKKARSQARLCLEFVGIRMQ